MEPQTKKYLTYGAVALGGLFLYSKWKSSSHEKKDAPKPKAKDAPLAPASPASIPYAGSSYPGAGYQPYQPPYVPPYYPPQQYPYPTPYIPPVTGYPSYPPPYVPGAGQPNVIGLSLAAPRSALQASGYYIFIRSVNGRPTPNQQIPPSGMPVAVLDLQSGIVRNVQYSALPYTGQPSPYGVTY